MNTKHLYYTDMPVYGRIKYEHASNPPVKMTTKEHSALLPEGSMAITVTVFVPRTTSDVEGLLVRLAIISELSVAVASHVTGSAASSLVMSAGHKTTGFSKSAQNTHIVQ